MFPDASAADRRVPRRGLVVFTLGVMQILAWGSSYGKIFK
jgi:hypothetical protein